MFNTKSQFYQANSTGRFQYRFKASIEIAQLPTLTPKSPTYQKFQGWFPSTCKTDQLDKQRKHLYDTRENHLEDLQIGIKTYKEANKESKTLCSLESLMQRKHRVPTHEEKRNHIPVRSLGDKIYSYPEFEANFYKQDDGLIAGSNVRKRFRCPFKISKKFHG